MGGIDGGTETSLQETSTALWEGSSRARCAAGVHLSARLRERKSAVLIRWPTARIKESRRMAPARLFSRSGSTRSSRKVRIRSAFDVERISGSLVRLTLD
jgi:hypothetical protein